EGGLRDLFDRITGEHLAKQREAWLAMQDLIRNEARGEVGRLWPLGAAADDERVRARLVLAFEEIVRLREEEAAGRDVYDRIDGAYLKLRQALEQALRILCDLAPPGDAWQKLYHGDRWIPKDSVQRTVMACALTAGFEVPTSSALLTPNPGKVRAACVRTDSSSLRPLCVALVLAAAEDASHPFRRLAGMTPSWLAQVDGVAEAAGAEVHVEESAERSFEKLQRDAEGAVRLCQDLLTAVARAHVQPA